MSRDETISSSVAAYSFVLFFASVAGTSVWLVWAWRPDYFEELLGKWANISLPSRYWALALPAWGCMAFMCSSLLYIASNLMVTPPLDSLDSITDSYSRPAPTREFGSRTVVPEIGDIDIREASRLLYLERKPKLLSSTDPATIKALGADCPEGERLMSSFEDLSGTSLQALSYSGQLAQTGETPLGAPTSKGTPVKRPRAPPPGPRGPK